MINNYNDVNNTTTNNNNNKNNNNNNNSYKDSNEFIK